MPVKRYLTYVAKAYRVLIKRVRTFRLWKMSHFVRELYKETLLLMTLDGFKTTCFRCKGEKAPLEGCHGDANSYFMRVTRQRIMQAVDWFIKEARER